MKAVHLAGQEICPFLPEPGAPLQAAEMKAFGKDRGVDFYRRALECAQSLWLQGLPAQSMLLMNRAFAAELSEEDTLGTGFALPYEAMHWVMSHRKEEQFIGNPRRHFQHLATRMVEPRKDLRSWRAWACWKYACQIFPDYPADLDQLEKEGIPEATEEEIREQLDRLGLAGETETRRKSVIPPSPECSKESRCSL